METKDILLDVVKHTAGLGIIENIKVTGTDEATIFEAIDADKTVILNARLHSAAPEFKGEFGMGNLGLLNSLTKLSNYNEDGASLEIVRETRSEEDGEIPTTIIFRDTCGSKDQYRFMSKAIVEQAMKIGKFRGADWKVVVQPTTLKVSQLAETAGIYSGVEPTFSVKTQDGELMFEVGSSEGGIIGRRTFASNVEGTLNSTWSWNLSTVLNILKLGMSGTCIIKFSDQGVCQIDIDSGVGLYSYILPAISQ